MRNEKASMTSRLEFLSNALGIALVTAGPWPVRSAGNPAAVPPNPDVQLKKAR